MKMKEYLLNDFFDISTTKSVDKNKIEFKNNAPYDFIGRTSTDWGVQGTVDKLDFAPNPKDSFSLVQVGETVALWREKEWYASQNLFLLKPKVSKIKDAFLYFQAVINKEMSSYGNAYNSYPTMKSLNKTSILLPVKTTLISDFESLDILIGGGTDVSNIDTSSWKEFRLDELFEKIKTEKISGKANDFPTCRTDEYTIPLLTAGADNQGLARYAKRSQCPTILKNVISISANGANTGVTFYQNNEFAVLQDAYAIKLKDIEIPNEQVGLFLASCISKILHGNFSWTYKAGWERIKDLSIKLPVKESEEIDWDYMQERIAELEQERIAELEQYLIATGLNDYELTDEDKEILATKLTDRGALQSSTSVNGCLKEARSFKLDELFEKIQTKKICGKANDFPVYKSEEYTVPLLTAGVDNQGFARYAKRIQCPTILKNVISISANGANTGVTFYQSDEFAVLQDAYAIKLKNMEIPNKQVGLFLAACINKILHGNFSWTFKAGWERIKEMSISLPINESGEIDWEYMEKYIKATEKVVIRDVVEWKNEMIKKTKEVVGGTAND